MKNILIITLIFAFSCNLSAEPPNYPHVLMQTDLTSGEFAGSKKLTVRLDHLNAPVTVDNFLSYVNTGFYDSTIIHRKDNNTSFSIIQGGIWVYDQSQLILMQAGESIINESYNGLSNKRGTIAMARTSDPNSASSQYFINQVDNLLFDKENYADGYGYCVFGEVTSGMDLVDFISILNTINLYDPNRPFTASLQQLPNQPLIVYQQVTTLPCDTTYCVNYIDDEVIDFQDFAAFASQYDRTDCNSANFFCSDTDLDFDGSVGISDLAIFMQVWLMHYGGDPVLSDFNISGTINLPDLEIFADKWLRTDCTVSNSYCEGGDLNQDGIVNFIDYQLFAENWLVQTE